MFCHPSLERMANCHPTSPFQFSLNFGRRFFSKTARLPPSASFLAKQMICSSRPYCIAFSTNMLKVGLTFVLAVSAKFLLLEAANISEIPRTASQVWNLLVMPFHKYADASD